MRLRNKRTGEIREDSDLGKMLSRYEMPSFESIAELCEEWEDYKPAEPLIKDEKIRKAVRAWAEAEEISVCRYKVPDTFESIDGTSKIEFGVFGFDEGRYTIAELCGEEEE